MLICHKKDADLLFKYLKRVIKKKQRNCESLHQHTQIDIWISRKKEASLSQGKQKE